MQVYVITEKKKNPKENMIWKLMVIVTLDMQLLYHEKLHKAIPTCTAVCGTMVDKITGTNLIAQVSHGYANIWSG